MICDSNNARCFKKLENAEKELESIDPKAEADVLKLHWNGAFAAAYKIPKGSGFKPGQHGEYEATKAEVDYYRETFEPENQ